MAQTGGGAAPRQARAPSTSVLRSTFGSTIAPGRVSANAAKSARPHSVASPFTRTATVPARNPPALTAATAACLAACLESGATASSKSRITASQDRPRAFSIARALEAGKYNTLRIIG